MKPDALPLTKSVRSEMRDRWLPGPSSNPSATFLIGRRTVAFTSDKRSANFWASGAILNSMQTMIPPSLSRQVDFDDSTRCSSSHMRIAAIWLERSPELYAISMLYIHGLPYLTRTILTISTDEASDLFAKSHFYHRPAGTVMRRIPTSLREAAVLQLRGKVSFTPASRRSAKSNQSSLACQKLTRLLPPLPLRVGAGLNELGAFSMIGVARVHCGAVTLMSSSSGSGDRRRGGSQAAAPPPQCRGGLFLLWEAYFWRRKFLSSRPAVIGQCRIRAR